MWQRNLTANFGDMKDGMHMSRKNWNTSNGGKAVFVTFSVEEHPNTNILGSLYKRKENRKPLQPALSTDLAVKFR